MMQSKVIFVPNSIGAMTGTIVWVILCSVSVLLLCAQVGIFARTFIRTRRRGDRFLVCFQLFVGVGLLSFLAYGFYYAVNDYYWNESELITMVYQQPVSLLVALEVMLVILALLVNITYYRQRRNTMSRRVLMETVNGLFAAICLCRKDGTILLANDKMNELSRKITGNELFDAASFLHALDEKGIFPSTGDSILMPLAEDEVWLFTEREIDTGAEALWQVTASDMTLQQAQARELEENNRHLSSLQEKLKTVSATERDMVAARESSRAKTTVHNQMGNVLLVGKYYMDHPEKTSEEELLRLLRFNNQNLIRLAEQSSDTEDPLEAAVRMAERIGLQVKVEGHMPKDKQSRQVMGEAIRQCATNAVRHGGADQLTVTIAETVRITNNGEAPKGPVRAGGGLGSLERMVQKAGGEMRLSADPEFLLELDLSGIE